LLNNNNLKKQQQQQQQHRTEKITGVEITVELHVAMVELE